MFTQNIQSRQAFGGTRLPSFSIGKYQNKEFNYEVLAQYKKSWKNFSLDASVGGNIYDREYTFLFQETVGCLSSPGFYDIQASIDRSYVTSSLVEIESRSFDSLVSVGYIGTYYLDACIRHDISSTLP